MPREEPRLFFWDKPDAGLAAVLVDLEPQFAIFRLRLQRRRIIGATATAEHPGVENSRLHPDAVARIRRPDQNHLERLVGHRTCSGQTLLQRQQIGVELLDFEPEGFAKASRVPGREGAR